ncbi:hypothetical protein P4S72_19635 [Vibrio sp. PP-XX7]
MKHQCWHSTVRLSPTNELNVRKAINYAVNKNTGEDGTLLRNVRQKRCLPPTFLMRHCTEALYFNPEKANQLLNKPDGTVPLPVKSGETRSTITN